MIGLNFIQLLTLLTTFPIEWPPIFTAIFQVGGAITSLGQHFINVKCLLPELTDADVFYTMVMTWSIMPFVLVFVIVLAFLVAKLIKPSLIATKKKERPSLENQVKNREKFRKKKQQSELNALTWTRIKCCIVATLYLLYPTLCSKTFSIFACKTICPDSSDLQEFLSSDLEEPCGVGRHLLYTWFLGVPMFIVYVFGFPAFGLISVWSIRQKALHSKRHSMHLIVEPFKVYGMLFSMFDDSTFKS